MSNSSNTYAFNPLRFGPYATVHLDCRGKWYRRLTDEGRDVAAEFFAKWPAPAAVLKRVDPALLTRANRKFQHDDLQQIARLGVIRAIAIYDPARGTRLSTFATWHVRAAIQCATDKARREVLDESGLIRPDWSHHFMAGVLDWTALRDPRSPDPGACHGGDLGTIMRQAGLTRRELSVLNLRFGLDGSGPRGLRDVGRVLGCTGENVRLIEREAFGKLREAAGVANRKRAKATA
jgi:hypothetical protein